MEDNRAVKTSDDELNEIIDSAPKESEENEDLYDDDDDGYYGDVIVMEDEDDDMKAGSICQWMTDDDTQFCPAGKTVQVLPPGMYNIVDDPRRGIIFDKVPIKTQGLLKLKGTDSSEVCDEISDFWNKEERYRKHKIAYKRGILLWGPAGTGKSSTIQIIVEDVVNRGGICVIFDDPYSFRRAMRRFREIQKETPVVVIMEDIDSTIEEYSETEVLNILDGLENVDKMVFLACHSPDTRLLTKDYRWVPAGEIKAGDELWGFDEHKSDIEGKVGRQTARKFCSSKVVSSFRAQKECVRVHLDTGESFVCTIDHPWLSYGAKKRNGKNHDWTLAKDLLERPNLVRPFIPWEFEDSWESGWFAGMLDGEGHLNKAKLNHPHRIGVTQVLGPTGDALVKCAEKYGNFNVDIKDPGNGHQKQYRSRSVDGIAGALSVLGTVRPKRLLEKVDLTGVIVQSTFKAKVVDIEYIGVQEIQSIETTSRTYLAEGFAVHNTTNHPEKLGHRICNRPSRFDRRFKIDFPSKEDRKTYIESLNSENLLDAVKIRKWIKDTEGFTFAHIKELFVSVAILENKYQSALDGLRRMKNNPAKEGKKSAGFSTDD